MSSKPLARALDIMDIVAAHPSGATMSEVAERLELPAPTAFRIIRHLTELGYLVGQGRHSRYRLGERFMRQYHNNITARQLVNIVRPTLRHLAAELDEVVYLNTLVIDEVRAICAEFPHSESARSMVMPGDRFPIHATASGKVVFAFQSQELQQQMIATEQLQPFRPNTQTEPEAVLSMLQGVRDQGFAVSDDEIDKDVYAVAVPIKLDGTGVIYSLGINGIKSRMLAKRDLEQIVKLLKRSAQQLSQLLRDSIQRDSFSSESSTN